ncbi:hypothetical protein [Metabacillus fastidiosus]|uniref:Uncharacterized protein n=1 Tax=Metabacillus fastidiosus TaxID=1458 RepID=A0ABU6NTU8_9BACI|nr:hypothetical protein [Metabacillus fastidiosus]MED4400018.1 hypothetical protein [Metabacillus fastidiosus]MED4462504.1 hypothetical protein [Metabacillus fastidiosus]
MIQGKLMIIGISIFLIIGISLFFFNQKAQNDPQPIIEEVNTDNARKENALLIISITDGLNNPAEIGDILVNYQESITVHTILDGTESNIKTRSKEIETKVKSILTSDELKSIDITPYMNTIKVVDKSGDVIN